MKKEASITFRTTPEFKEFLKKQPKMSQWIEDACKIKRDKEQNVLQITVENGNSIIPESNFVPPKTVDTQIVRQKAD